MLAGNLVTGIDDLLTALLKSDGLLGGFTHLVLKHLLQLLTFLDDRVELFGDAFIVALFEHGLLLLQFGDVLVALGLDLGDAGVDGGSLFAFGNCDLVFEALQGFLAGFLIHIGHDVLSEVKHTVEVAAGNIQQHAHLRRDAAGIPNMRHRGGKRNMSHALAAHGRAGYFNAALFTSDTFIAGVLILAAITLPVSSRSKDRFTEQSILFRAKAAIIDGFGFQHLAIRPRHDRLRRG